MASILAVSRPSEKFGTHSTSCRGMYGAKRLLLAGLIVDAHGLMCGHLPLAVVLHVDFQCVDPIRELVGRLDVDVTVQDGGLAIHADLSGAIGERFVSSRPRDSRD